MRAKTACAWGFYWAGDLLHRVLPRNYFGPLWDLYQWLMQRSGELDPDYEVWTKVEESEEVGER